MKYLLFFLTPILLFAQANFTSDENVYDFLERQYSLGRIRFNTHVKPSTRKEIQQLLQQLEQSSNDLNFNEQKELSFWLKDYAKSSAPDTTILSKNENGVFRFFEYNDSLFNVVSYPDFGVSYSRREMGKSQLYYYGGISIYGNIGENLTFDLDFNDYNIKSSGVSTDRTFSPERGYDYPRNLKSTKTLNYDRTLGSISYDWNWGLISFRKQYNYWGTGYNGKIILSDKAPTFPHLYLKIRPVDWLQFDYFHGSLSSFVQDSSSLRQSGGTREHILQVEKYLVAHTISLHFFDFLNISISHTEITVF